MAVSLQRRNNPPAEMVGCQDPAAKLHVLRLGEHVMHEAAAVSQGSEVLKESDMRLQLAKDKESRHSPRAAPQAPATNNEVKEPELDQKIEPTKGNTAITLCWPEGLFVCFTQG